MTRRSLLLIEDDPVLRSATASALRTRGGFDVVAVATCPQARERCAAARPDAALLDLELPDGAALDLLRDLREASVPVVALTGEATMDLALRALEEGAEQFLTKPVEVEALVAAIQRAVHDHRNRRKQLAGEAAQARAAIDPFLGTSEAIRRLRDNAARVAAAEGPVLIVGENGSGKGALARWLHRASPRGEEPFVDLSCAGLATRPLASELFGCERAGAERSKQGLLEIAHRGTVFLDELGDADPQTQLRLLELVERKRFRRLDDVRDRAIDVRLIAATHEDLSQAVHDERFRADLFSRMSAFALRVPPLRERIEDVPRIAAALLERIEGPRRGLRLSRQALATLHAYEWPGNVRELRNVLERAAIVSRSAELEPADLRFQLDAPPAARVDAPAAEMTMQAAERHHIESMLRRAGNVADAARILAMPKSTLYYKLKKFGIAIPTARNLERH